MIRRKGFASTLVGISRSLGSALVSEDIAHRAGLLQSIDPRVRLVGIFLLILAVTLAHKVEVISVLFGAALLLALASRVPLATLALRVWLPVAFFTGVIATPALFVTPGTPILTAPSGNLQITSQGLSSAILLIVRVETAATLATLLVLTTPWMDLLRALRSLRVPPEVVMMLAMSHRYIFLLAETAGQMLESRESRTVGELDRTTERQVLGRTAGVLLAKSTDLGNDVHLAMQSRGFQGDARVLADSRLHQRDYFALALFLAAAALTAWVGRL